MQIGQIVTHSEGLADRNRMDLLQADKVKAHCFRNLQHSITEASTGREKETRPLRPCSTSRKLI